MVFKLRATILMQALTVHSLGSSKIKGKLK